MNNNQNSNNGLETTTNALTAQTILLVECLEKLDKILANQAQLKNIVVSQVSISASSDRGNENGNATASF